MFNIGGQGQYFIGLYFAIWLGCRFARHVPVPAHHARASWAATLAGAAWAGIAGFLKATVGAHEVISTIMLNWIAIWVGVGPVRRRRAAAERRPDVDPDLERHRRRGEAAGLLGDQAAAGPPRRVLHRARGARRLLGDAQPDDARLPARAVGFNPEAARYGGISVARNLFRAMAISGARRSRRRARHHRLRVPLRPDRHPGAQIGFPGLAAALLGRNTALGVGARRPPLRRAHQRDVGQAARPV